MAELEGEQQWLHTLMKSSENQKPGVKGKRKLTVPTLPCFLDSLPSLHQENHSFVPFLGLTALSLSIDPRNMQTSSLHLNLGEAIGRHYVFLVGLVEWLCSAPMHWLRCDIKI